MAIKSALDFAIKIIGDGTDGTYVISTATGPFGLTAPSTAAGASEVAPALTLSTLVPNGVVNIASQNGHSVSASVALGVLTITYAAVDIPAANEVDVITGLFTFPG